MTACGDGGWNRLPGLRLANQTTAGRTRIGISREPEPYLAAWPEAIGSFPGYRHTLNDQ